MVLPYVYGMYHTYVYSMKYEYGTEHQHLSKIAMSITNSLTLPSRMLHDVTMIVIIV